MKEQNQILYSSGDLAKAAGVSHQCIYEAVRRGTLTPKLMTRGGRFLFTESEVRKYCNQQIQRRINR